MAEEFDDAMRDELREAVVAAAQPSEGFVDLVMAGYDLLAADAELAELVFDSDSESLAIRSPQLDARVLRFEFGQTTIEFALRRDDDRILGTVDPPPVAVHFEQDGVSSEVQVDGRRFEVAESSSSPLRFKIEAGDGTVLATEWVLP